jgi:hypothetical protein
MYLVFLGSTAQELKEKGIDSKGYMYASYALIFCSIAYFLYLWLNKKADKVSDNQSHNKNKSKPIHNEPYPDEKYYAIALKEIQVNKLSSA